MEAQNFKYIEQEDENDISKVNNPESHDEDQGMEVFFVERPEVKLSGKGSWSKK